MAKRQTKPVVLQRLKNESWGDVAEFKSLRAAKNAALGFAPGSSYRIVRVLAAFKVTTETRKEPVITDDS